jgi:2-polyprenyl-3-methyl-5-hydroxy-6-metoxy-1,4-benzoquinol methylase
MDHKKRKFDYIKRFIREGIIYDMGCAGTNIEGNLHSYLVDGFPNSKIYGVDSVDSESTDIRFDLNNIFPERWKQADTIIASEVIEHLDNPYIFLRQCLRLLNNDGILIITTPNPSNLGFVFGKQDSKVHKYSWTLEALKNLVESAGFRLLSAEKVNIWYDKNILARLICWAFPTLRPSLYLVAQRISNE